MTKSERFRTLGLVIVLGSISLYLIVYLLNKLPVSYYDGVLISKYQVIWQTLILSSAFLIPTILVNFLNDQTDEISYGENIVWLQHIYRFFRSLSIILLVVYFGIHQPDGILSIGLYIGENNTAITVILSGLIIFIYFGGGYSLINKYLLKIKSVWDLSKPGIKEFVDNKTTSMRFVSLLLLLICVLSEELLFRGFIVLLLGKISNQIYLFGVVSIILSVLTHYYQGKDKLLFHLLFAMLLVGVTIFSGNILLAITIHIFNNLYVAIMTWRIVDKKFDSGCLPNNVSFPVDK